VSEARVSEPTEIDRERGYVDGLFHRINKFIYEQRKNVKELITRNKKNKNKNKNNKKSKTKNSQQSKQKDKPKKQ